jgi:tRNA(adenine34) deaminase
VEKDIFFMRAAQDEAAQAAAEVEAPVGAVVDCKGRIVSRGHNMTERLGDVTAHAEMLALTGAANALGGKYLPECTLYVTLEPCVMCAGAIGWAQLGRLVYGAGDEKRGFRRFAPEALHPKTAVTGGVLEAECGEVMRRFFRERR